jgi:P4 family phage/plasmid primase-like protien|uniref:SF3 helicase domain-containing protein n=1 Tax=viral metagenome TaxID=1070528 RepID=A0A6C0LJ01_9ZZZZ
MAHQEKFKSFISKHKVEKGKQYTNTSIGNPKVALYIANDEYTEFLNLYSLAIANGTSLHYTEKPVEPSPLRVDLDFRFSMPINENGEPFIQRLYTDDNVYKIIDNYFKIINTYLDIDEKSNVAYVMEKPYPTEFRNKIKDGIHIIFPHVIIDNNTQFFIRKKILDIASQIFKDLYLCNEYEDIIDKAIINANCWQMYGSKKPESEAYRVTKIYNYKEETIMHDYVPSAELEISYIKLFSMRNITTEPTKINESYTSEIEEYIRHILPIVDKKLKEKLENNILLKKEINVIKNYTNDDDYVLARELITECLSQTRAERYNDWINLGWVLRNIDYRLLAQWTEFSKIGSNYIEGECQNLWDKMRKDHLGMGTLRWWAKTDNPQRYKEIIDNSVIPLIDISIGSEGAHYDVAKLVQVIYKGEYKAVNKDTWYKYDRDSHCWIKTREGLNLRRSLSEEICRKFLDRAMHYNTLSSNNAYDKAQQSMYSKRGSEAMKIASNLKKTSYKDSVMKECKCLFIDENFEELLDCRPHLIGFKNGVYDMKMHIFREGMPDDYISLSTKRNYIPYSIEYPEIVEINDFFEKVFTNVNVRNYVLDILACIIDGSIAQERFYIFTGQGSNGKSRLLDLIQKSVGDYYATLPIALLTQKRAASNSAQGEIERMKGRRFAVMQEPNENDKINVGYMKELSGNDRILTRGLYKEPYEFKPQFKMILACNELPEIPSQDGGVWRRLRVVEFASKFCENPDPSKPNEFMMDLELSDKFDRYADHFVSMLIERHKNINPNKITEPREVINATQKYKDNNDVIGQYVNDRIIKDESAKEKIGIMEVYADFKSWGVENVAKGKKQPDRQQLRSYIDKIYGIYIKDGWKGFRLKND